MSRKWSLPSKSFRCAVGGQKFNKEMVVCADEMAVTICKKCEGKLKK